MEKNFEAIFKGAAWHKGTKKDPNKEYGILSFCFVVPKADGTSFVKDVDEFIFDKDLIPKDVDLMEKINVVYEINDFCPVSKAKFIKVV